MTRRQVALLNVWPTHALAVVKWYEQMCGGGRPSSFSGRMLASPRHTLFIQSYLLILVWRGHFFANNSDGTNFWITFVNTSALVFTKKLMPRRKTDRQNNTPEKKSQDKVFYLEFLTPAQKLAWNVYQQHDIVFLLGAAGTGKSFLAMAFALQDLFGGSKKKIVLTRPIVEAGENLGFLPGTLDEKVQPYMTPLYDCLGKMVGQHGQSRMFVEEHLEVAPIAYLRGRTFNNSVCILDEAQNCSFAQLTLFLTRLGEGSKMIITGDPEQSDLFQHSKTPLAEMMDILSSVDGVGVVEFPEKYIVRHPLVGKILKRLKEAKKKSEVLPHLS